MTICRAQTLFFAVFCGLFWTATAEAQSRLPVYDAASGSYFQLYDDNTHPSVWSAARKRAQSKTYKGIRGRLAEIRSPETHELLIETFDLRRSRAKAEIWIGLRYWCNVQMLQWGYERPYSPAAAEHFKMWHDPWQRYPNYRGGVCGTTGSRQIGYAPVYYTTISGESRWQAAGGGKGFRYYLVEFPAPEETEEEATGEQAEVQEKQPESGSE